MSNRWCNKLLLALIIGLLACGSSGKLSKVPGEDQAVFTLLDQINKGEVKGYEAKEMLKTSYSIAKSNHLRQIDALSAYPSGENFEKMMARYQLLNNLSKAIESSPVAAGWVDEPFYDREIEAMRNQAADAYYKQAIVFMGYNQRSYAAQAYDLFQRVNRLSPGYKDVISMMRMAEESAILKVMVNPINYHSFSFQYWGMQQDLLQRELVRELRTWSNSNFVRFFTDQEAFMNRIHPDRVVDVRWTDIFIQPVNRQTFTRTLSKQIKTGETKSIPAKPIYKTVYATLQITRLTLQAHGNLECRVTEAGSMRPLMWDNFPSQYSWLHEYATFTGDQQALGPDDWRLVQANGNVQAPNRAIVYQQLYQQSFPALVQRIRTVNWQ